MTGREKLYYIRYMAQMWYLSKDVGRLKKGVITHSDFMKLGRSDREDNTMRLSRALAQGLVEADASEADNINKLTFYAPGEMPKKSENETQNNTPQDAPKKKKFLVNKLGEIIRAKEEKNN